MKRSGRGVAWIAGASLAWCALALGAGPDGSTASPDVGGWPDRPADIDATTWSALKDAVAKTQQATLVAADGAAGDAFGISVALSGDTALVGAYADDIGANIGQGSAYVFTRVGATWTQQAKLVAADGAGVDGFGVAVALAGDTALVGAYLDDTGTNTDQGSAYVFVRSGGTWTQQAKLVASDGSGDDYFGESVAINGDTALVGARIDDVGTNADQGSAYVFVRAGGAWSEQAKLVADDGAAIDMFGTSVAIAGDTALVGAPRDGGAFNQGAAYVFLRSGTSWAQQAKLVAGDGAVSDFFGYAVALSGNTALVAAIGDDIGTSENQGSAYVFQRSGVTWTQQAKLLAGDGAAFDFFGRSVALSGDLALVGAYVDDVDSNMDQGSAYSFERVGATWTPQSKLVAGDGAAVDQFGVAVALSGTTALVGAYLDDVFLNTDRGSTGVFILPPPPLVFADGFE